MDNGKAIFRFANRTLGSLDIYFSVREFRLPSWEIEVVGSRGAVRTQQTNYEGALFVDDGPRVFHRSQNDVLRAEVQAWFDCCRSGTQPEVTVEHARSVIEVALACRQSSQQHVPVALPVQHP
jgi:predicted dehydrogenase